jgi:hypothetical protein
MKNFPYRLASQLNLLGGGDESDGGANLGHVAVLNKDLGEVAVCGRRVRAGATWRKGALGKDEVSDVGQMSKDVESTNTHTPYQIHMETCSNCYCLRDCSHVGAHEGARGERLGNYPSSKASTSMSALSDSTTMRMSPAAFHSSASCALGSQHKQSVHRGREKRKKKLRSAHLTSGDLVSLRLGPLDNLALGHGGGKGGHEHGGSAVGKLGTA